MFCCVFFASYYHILNAKYVVVGHICITSFAHTLIHQLVECQCEINMQEHRYSHLQLPKVSIQNLEYIVYH